MRPGHFRGVTTVVSVLFNIVQPDLAVFGEKDFQQLRLIEKMVEDLKLDISIIRGPLVRESDGLAMSSRNVRLSPEARRQALLISKGLFAAQELFENGERGGERLTAAVWRTLSQTSAIRVEYVACVSERDLSELMEVNRPARLLVAAVVGGVRLIDNIGLMP
jgi:pantoate--beta-alanine ligase